MNNNNFFLALIKIQLGNCAQLIDFENEMKHFAFQVLNQFWFFLHALLNNVSLYYSLPHTQ